MSFLRLLTINLKPSTILYSLVLVLIMPMVIAAAPPIPEFHQVHGSITPPVASGTLTIQVGSRSSQVAIRDGVFGDTPIKLDGSQGDLINLIFNNTALASADFKSRAITSFDLKIASPQAGRDSLIGNPPSGVQVFVDGSPISDRRLGGVHTITFAKSGSQPSVIARVDFGGGALDLSQVRIESSSQGRGGISVSSLSLPPGSSKTLRVPRAGQGQSVCLRDSPSASFSEFTKSCTGQNEIALFCDGIFNFGFRCTLEQDVMVVEGLKHSAVAEILPQDDPVLDESLGSTQSSSSSSPTTKNITIRKYKLNLSKTPQTFDLDVRDALEFNVLDKRIIMTHIATASGSATFKTLPTGDDVILESGLSQDEDVTGDGVPDVSMLLVKTVAKNATVRLVLPTSIEIPVQVPSEQPIISPGVSLPTKTSAPQQPEISPIRELPPGPAPISPIEPVETISAPAPDVASGPTIPVSSIASPSIEQPLGSYAIAVAFAQANPWVIPSLAVGLVAVIGLLGYAAYLLYKELQAVKEITEYVNQTLSQGFSLPQIIEALRQNKWSQAHIQKSLEKVAKGYVQVALKAGKGALQVRDELMARAWPIEIIEKVAPVKK